MRNPGKKIARLAATALAADVRSLSGVPSWLLVLFDALHALRPASGGRLVDYFPKLDLLVHGGVDFAPYRHRFEGLLAGSHAELREVYTASEGFIAVADRTPEDGLRPLLGNGLFFEFVPVDELEATAPTRHWAATLEPGVNYAIAVSSCAGAWAYLIGDTVRVLSRNPPRLTVTGRTSYMGPPEVRLAPPGTFAAWMKARGQLGGQHKVPRIINDQSLLTGLLKFLSG